MIMRNIATANYLTICLGLAICLGINSPSDLHKPGDNSVHAAVAPTSLCFADQLRLARSDCKVVLKTTDLTNVRQVNFTLSAHPAPTFSSNELQLQTVEAPQLTSPLVATPSPKQLHSAGAPVEIMQELSLRPIPTPADAKAEQAESGSEPVSYHF